MSTQNISKCLAQGHNKQANLLAYLYTIPCWMSSREELWIPTF